MELITTRWLFPVHRHCNDCSRWFFAFQIKWNQTLHGDYLHSICIVMTACGDSSHFRWNGIKHCGAFIHIICIVMIDRSDSLYFRWNEIKHRSDSPWFHCFPIKHLDFLALFLLLTTTVVSACFPMEISRIDVTTQLTTCHYYRIEGGGFNGLLKPFLPSAYVWLSDRFRLLLSACFFHGWLG